MISFGAECVHFWDIEELGIEGVWHGTCRKCRAERDFRPVRLEDEYKALVIRPKELMPY